MHLPMQIITQNMFRQGNQHSCLNRTEILRTPRLTRSTKTELQEQTHFSKLPRRNYLKLQIDMREIQSLVDKKVKESAAAQQQLSQSGIEDSAIKRSLRPRKVENYKNMLEGDEITLKTIQDEQIEVKRKKREASSQNRLEDEDEDEDMLEVGQQIERASDDEDDDDFPISTRRSARKRTRRQDVDEDEEAIEVNQVESSDAEVEIPANDIDTESYTEGTNKRKQKLKAKKQVLDKKKNKTEGDIDKEDAVEEEETVFIDNLPNDEFEIRRMLKEVKKHIKSLEKQFFEEEDSEKEEELKQINNNSKHEEALQAFKETSHLKQFWCIPLSVNVTTLDFDLLAKSQMKQGGRLFDVITIDPPWQLSSANPTRGVAIAYDTLNDKEILNMPFEKVQTDGFLFIWVINAKYRFALEMMEKFGYKLVDEIAWVKQTVNGKIAKGHGYYLQHAKETCLVGVKGNVKGKARYNIESDVIFSQRRGQSQKPEEIYEIAEALVPNGYYLEIFGRRNNLHNGWVTIGNEL
eukprot:403359546